MIVSAGNKAQNLDRLKESGFNVPDFVVAPLNLSKDEFYSFVSAKQDNLYAVRSSSETEDSNNESKAGYYYSSVGVNYNNLYKEYVKVLESFNGVQGGVIVQTFIPTECSGVLFTNNGDSKIIINANYGLCKSVVEGALCDEWVLLRDGLVYQKKIADAKQALYLEQGTLVWKSVEGDSLNRNQLKKLIEMSFKVESFFKSAQDIEWGFYKKQLYILQSRPITKDIPIERELIHFDSANIAESYSGIVKPLTISFAKYIYKTVYYNLINSSGVTHSKLKQYNYVFDGMISSYFGRIYYNMNNWYRMTAFIPGYNRNKANLEQMITSNIRKSIDHHIFPSVWLKVKYPFIVIKKMLFFRLTQNRFKKNTINLIKTIRSKNLSEFSIDELKELFQILNKQLIEKWHISVENDFMVMTFFGLLKKRFSEDNLSNLIHFESKATQQIEAIKRMYQYINSQKELTKYLQNRDYSELQKQIELIPEFKKQIDAYFIEFGGRFANELKLESPDIEEDKAKFFDMIRNYSSFNIKSNKAEKVKLKLLDLWILRKFKMYASQREEMRLLRSNGFSLVRRIFNQLEQIYLSTNKLNKKGDIYYLSLKEAFNGLDNFKKIVEDRKKEYHKFESVNPPAFFSIAEGELPSIKEQEFTYKVMLNGRGCSTGIIEGVVNVMPQYIMPEKIDFDILVTGHTDPGWSPLLGLVKGLIIEHGGVLSHAAIVARELGIPTVIGVDNAMQYLKTGQRVKVNGGTGQINIKE